MKQEDKVTVLLTSYNRPKNLDIAIKSVLAQTYDNFELFILDDNSNQETIDVINKYIGLPQVKYYNSFISEEGRKTTGCRYALNINYGIDNSDGEFITYLTDDDFFLPGRLEVMVDYLNKNPQVSVVYGQQQKLNVDSNGNETDAGVRAPNSILKSAAHNIDHNSVLHRRSIFEKIAKWPLHDWRCADAAFWNQINNAGFDFYPIKEITDCKRYHQETISAKLDTGRDILSGHNE